MVTRIGGSRRKTRRIFKKEFRQRGKVSLARYFAAFTPGDRVLLLAEPAVQKGIYHQRFHGKMGVVVDRKGFCYEVQIQDKNKAKTLIVHPIHLRRFVRQDAAGSKTGGSAVANRSGQHPDRDQEPPHVHNRGFLTQ